jgi:hypothetical protein
MTPVLNTLMMVQLLMQNKTACFMFDNDAKGCYDRSASGIAITALRRIGYSKNSVKTLGLLWAELEHHVCTGDGVSNTTLSSTSERILYGIGQGSCASPIIWAILNQLILTALDEKFECIHLVEVDSITTHYRTGNYFVGDTKSGATNDYVTMEPVERSETALTSEEEALVAKMEEIIHFFLDCLQVTGGDLAPETGVWYMIAHRWK